MALIYMTHPQHGVHIVYSEDDQKACEKEGWSVHGPTPPGREPRAAEAAHVADVPRETLHLPKRKAGRPRKAA